MKKFAAIILSLTLVFAATGAFAADIKVNLNGEEIAFDVQPILDGENLLLPLRFIYEKMGANVSWYEETNTVFADLGGNITTIQIGNELMFLNGDSFKLDTVPVLKDDRTLVPAAVIENGTGAKVSWDAEKSTVSIEK